MENIFPESKRHRPTVYTKKESVPGAFSNNCRVKVNVFQVCPTPPPLLFLGFSVTYLSLPQTVTGFASALSVLLDQTSQHHQWRSSLNTFSLSLISLFKATWENIWLPSYAFKMNAITSSVYIWKFIKERNSELRTDSNWIEFPVCYDSSTSYVTLCSFLLYKMWMITYLTDVCEKPFQSP